MAETFRDIHIFTHEFFPNHGGAGVVAEQMAIAAQMRGYRVRLWAPQMSMEASKGTRKPFNILPLPVKGSMDWSCRVQHVSQVVRYIKRYGFRENSILHIVEPGAMLSWLYFQLRRSFPKNLPIVITLHGSEILRFSGSFHRKALFWRFLKRVRRIQVLSESNRQLLFKNFPRLRQDKVIVTPGAPRILPPSDTPKIEIPNKANRLAILSVGRIHPRKGHRLLLSCLKQLSAEEQKQICLWFAGRVVDRRYQREVEISANRSKIPIHFFGPVSDADLQKLYNASDIFAMTSRQTGSSIEGFGLVYLEASQAGLPIIANRTGGVSEAVIDGTTGLLANPGDSDSLLKAIRSLIQNPEIRRTLGEAGKKFADRVSWKNAAASVYNNI
ncbi:MAG: glycosyltransferase family 4 protein [Verrucomicrobiota bacterium]